MKKYRINEIFFSIQGEGIRQGTANVFVRFAGCNLKCNREDSISGFDCDSEFTSGVSMTKEEIYDEVIKIAGDCRNIIFTGGEPSLQVDDELVDYFKDTDDEFPPEFFYLAIETNGTNLIPEAIDWITVSPKSAEHTLRIKKCNELKYVRNVNQGIPKPSIESDYLLISPAFEPSGAVLPETLNHCIELVKNHPEWRLSVQQHKFWNVR